MNERERLIELLDIADTCYMQKSNPEPRYFSAFVAGYLITNGVRIPVRCKDCKHEDDDVMCPIYSWWLEDKNSFFCAFGERRADNGT